MRQVLLLTLSSIVFIGACGQKTESSTVRASSPQLLDTNEASTSLETQGIGSKELAKCAVINNQLQRLSCYDDLAKKYGQAPASVNTTSGFKGRWRTSTDTDPLTDKSVQHASVEAHEGRGRYGDALTLHIRCRNGKTEAYVDWSTFLGSDYITVTSRIDKLQAEKSTWSLSTDKKASFMPQAVTTLKKFIGASSYVVNLTPYSENPITAVFDVSASEEAFKDIRRDCKW